MRNKDKFKSHKERAIAHQQWCKETAVQGWWCSLKCTRCYLGWLEMECEEKDDAKQG